MSRTAESCVTTDEGPSLGGDVVKSISIEGLLAQRATMLASVVSAIAELRKANAIAEAACITRQYHGFAWILFGPEAHRMSDVLADGWLEDCRKRLDAGAWHHLMNESGLLSFMDRKAREELREKIDKCETPELTRDNIAATFGQLYEARGDMFERGVINLFKSLSWNYKSNQPQKFGKRIVMRLGQGYAFGYTSMDGLSDMQRCFCLLDGKPEEDHRNSLASRLQAAQRKDCGQYQYHRRGVHDDTYVRVRWFQNGNGHIFFRRQDLVERMNKIISKHYPDALPAAREDS